MLLCAFLFLAGFAPAHAQFWEKKEYRQWSQADCKKMLEDSPWAHKFSVVEVRQDAFVEGATAQDSRAQVDYVARLQSALPVRQAVIRLAMIRNKYDKMTSEQKAQFDESAERFLAVNFDDRIVVQVDMSSTVISYTRQLSNFWASVREDAVPVNVLLIGTSGQRVIPARYAPPQGGSLQMEFTFPRRTAEGSLVEESNKPLMMEMPGLRMREITEPRVLFQFKAPKTKFQGQLAY